MKKVNILENLKLFFDKTPKEDILDIWNKLNHYDNVGVSLSKVIKTKNN